MNTGEIFKYYRENKGMSVSETCENIVSPQFLRKFEKGSSDISYSNLLLLLQKIGITIREFIKFEDKFEWENILIHFDFVLGEAIMMSNSFELEGLISEFQGLATDLSDSRFYYLSNVAKSYHTRLFSPTNLTVESIEEVEIIDYLRKVDYWTSLEYFLASNITLSLSQEEIIEKCDLIFSREFDVTCANTRILDYITHIPLQLVSSGEYKLANQVIDTYLNKISTLRNPQFIHFDLYAIYIKGILLLKTDAVNAEEKCKRIIDIFSQDLGYTFYANRLNITFTKYKEFFRVKE